MHTAICAFEDKARAEEALASLERSGFARHDLHIEHEHLDSGRHSGTDRWDSMEREVAVDRSRLSSFVEFFGNLFAHENLSDEVEAYSRHVQGGNFVVVVDTHDAAEAERARALLHGMDASHLNVVHRPEEQRLRDIVAQRSDSANAGMVERSSEAYEATGSAGPGLVRDRAMAGGVVSPTTGPDLRDPELERSPGLRYSDKDKPLG